MVNGICKLTGEYGKFVDSHLIPKALTKPESAGQSFLEAGNQSRPIRRHSSWYDNRLVINAGEEILAKLDDWAIKKLRAHKMVWSGWGPMMKLSGHKLIPGSPWGLRMIEDEEWPRLRLFFLSLLWRAGASSRREFAEVSISEEQLEILQGMVVKGDPTPLHFFPVQLTQLSTMGLIHNQTPFSDTKVIPATEKRPEHSVPFFRFYFDGLIAHFDRRSPEAIKEADLDGVFLGNSEHLRIPTVTYEESFQRKNIEAIMFEADSLSDR